jgi:hypothetical protein
MACLQAQHEGTGPFFRNPVSALLVQRNYTALALPLLAIKMATVATILLV